MLHKKFMNKLIKYPHGESVKDLLIRDKKNLAKGVALRNCFLRPYYEKWKRVDNEFENTFEPILNNAYSNMEKAIINTVCS